MTEKTNLNQQASRPRKKNDELLKGAFEDNFHDFLRFVYPGVEEVVNFNQPIEFLDKELFAIIPDRERTRDGREADLLAKLYMKDGTEKWVLLNVEIEGSSDRAFGYRLFQYNYRIRDKYKVSVATVAVFTGHKNQHRPEVYEDTLLGTALSFKFLSYHVFDHSQEELMKMNNPFALIVAACQDALLEGKIPEEELSDRRLNLAKALLKHNYGQDRILSFLSFLKNFLFIENKEINRKFEQLVEEITNGKTKMGVIEVLKMQAAREGRETGREEAFQEANAKALLEKKEIARNFKNKGIDLDIIADSTGLSLETIKAL